jgi:hypothetical protein
MASRIRVLSLANSYSTTRRVVFRRVVLRFPILSIFQYLCTKNLSGPGHSGRTRSLLRHGFKRQWRMMMEARGR